MSVIVDADHLVKCKNGNSSNNNDDNENSDCVNDSSDIFNSHANDFIPYVEDVPMVRKKYGH